MMQSTQSNTSRAQPVRRGRKFLFYLVASFVLGATLSFFEYLGKQPVIHVRAAITSVENWICESSPDLAVCQLRQTRRDELGRNIARLPTLDAALARMQWGGGNEVLAARYAALVRSIQHYSFENGAGREYFYEIARDALWPVWQEHPLIVSASHCYWCYNHDINLYQWFNLSDRNDDVLLRLAQTTPHLFGQFHQRLNLTDAEKLRLAQLQSLLAQHGNRGDFLSRVLRHNNDAEHFSHLVRNTISAAPLMNADWSTVPFEDARLSWEEGVRHNDDLPRFTEYMLTQGYRPALRWLLWILAETEHSYELRKYQGRLDAYRALYEKYVDFDRPAWQSPDQFYSDNWKAIGWQPSAQKWMMKPAPAQHEMNARSDSDV